MNAAINKIKIILVSVKLILEFVQDSLDFFIWFSVDVAVFLMVHSRFGTNGSRNSAAELRLMSVRWLWREVWWILRNFNVPFLKLKVRKNTWNQWFFYQAYYLVSYFHEMVYFVAKSVTVWKLLKLTLTLLAIISWKRRRY